MYIFHHNLQVKQLSFVKPLACYLSIKYELITNFNSFIFSIYRIQEETEAEKENKGDGDGNANTEDNTSYNIEFTFDSDVRVAVTIYYFATEEINAGQAV